LRDHPLDLGEPVIVKNLDRMTDPAGGGAGIELLTLFESNRQISEPSKEDAPGLAAGFEFRLQGLETSKDFGDSLRRHDVAIAGETMFERVPSRSRFAIVRLRTRALEGIPAIRKQASG
jgi:hypothetical protein